MQDDFSDQVEEQNLVQQVVGTTESAWPAPDLNNVRLSSLKNSGERPLGIGDLEESQMSTKTEDFDQSESKPEFDNSELGSAEVKPKAPVGVIKVRLLELSDRFQTHRILVQHHANTVFRDQAFSDWKFNANFDGVMSRAPRTVGLAVTFNDEVIGVAWGTADSYILSDGPLFVTVQLIAVDLEIGPIRRAKAFLSLVAGIKQWAASLNASHSFIHVTTGSNLAATDRLMKAAGAQTVGGAYVV